MDKYICRQCKRELTIDKFYKNKSKTLWRETICIECIKNNNNDYTEMTEKDYTEKERLISVFLNDEIIKNNIKIKWWYTELDICDYHHCKWYSIIKLKKLFNINYNIYHLRDNNKSIY